MKFKLSDNFLIITPIVFSPYYFLSIPGINLTLFDVLIFLSFTILSIKHKSININPVNYYYAAIIFLFIALLPIINYGLVPNHILGFIQLVYILLILYPFITTYINKSNLEESFKIMCRCWSIFIILHSVLIIDINYYYGGRFVGLYGAPLQMGLIIAVIFPVTLFCISNERKKLFKILLLLGLITGLITLLFTASRGAMIGLLFGIIVYYSFKYRIIYNIKVVLLLVLSIVFIIILISQIQIFDRNPIERLFSDENIGVRIQDYLLVLSPNTIWDLIFGVGFNNSGAVLQELGGIHRPHNLFISLFKETGVIGLVVFVYLLYISVFKGLIILTKNMINNRINNELFITTISSSIVFIIAQQTSPLIIHRFYWIFLFLCMIYIHKNKLYINQSINK